MRQWEAEDCVQVLFLSEQSLIKMVSDKSLTSDYMLYNGVENILFLVSFFGCHFGIIIYSLRHRGSGLLTQYFVFNLLRS